MKKIALILAVALSLGGCTGVPVVYSGECDCPTAAPAAENALKTGLHVSARADSAADGVLRFDLTAAAVTIDDSGVIRGCAIDGVDAALPLGADGKLAFDPARAPASRREAASALSDSWIRQADAVAALAVGKTVEELRRSGAEAAELIDIIEAAAADARHRGAQLGDEVRLSLLSDLSSSRSASGAEGGLLQLDSDFAAVTLRGEVISSCRIDSVQAALPFDAGGALTGELPAAFPGKNALGEAYGLKKYAGSRYEWNEQAEAFCHYVSGKTAEEVAGIAVDERRAPAESDLSASVTISIGGFQALIERAAGA